MLHPYSSRAYGEDTDKDSGSINQRRGEARAHNNGSYSHQMAGATLQRPLFKAWGCEAGDVVSLNPRW